KLNPADLLTRQFISRIYPEGEGDFLLLTVKRSSKQNADVFALIGDKPGAAVAMLKPLEHYDIDVLDWASKTYPFLHPPLTFTDYSHNGVKSATLFLETPDVVGERSLPLQIEFFTPSPTHSGAGPGMTRSGKEPGMERHRFGPFQKMDLGLMPGERLDKNH